MRNDSREWPEVEKDRAAVTGRAVEEPVRASKRRTHRASKASEPEGSHPALVLSGTLSEFLPLSALVSPTEAGQED